MDARELKGMQIAATMQLRRSTYGWIVPSQTGTGKLQGRFDQPRPFPPGPWCRVLWPARAQTLSCAGDPVSTSSP